MAKVSGEATYFEQETHKPLVSNSQRPFFAGIWPGRPGACVLLFLWAVCRLPWPGCLSTLSLISTFCLTPGPGMKPARPCIISCLSVPFGVFALHLCLRGAWPAGLFYSDRWFSSLPPDFEERLSQAFCGFIWPLLCKGSSMLTFTENDLLVILSHNLDY
jgi:hypothetical protein